MSQETETLQTITEPEALAFCAYCGLHATKDNFIDQMQMCSECYERYRLEVEHGKDTTPPQE